MLKKYFCPYCGNASFAIRNNNEEIYYVCLNQKCYVKLWFSQLKDE